MRHDAYLHEFFSDSVIHPHGWGLSWREGTDVVLFKEPVTAVESAYLEFLLAMDTEAKLSIAHIRNATRGILSYANCHPFVGVDSSGRSWVVAHNGTMLAGEALEPYVELQQGQTDSERVMLFLVDRINEAMARLGRSLDAGERFGVLSRCMEELSAGNKLNLVFDDGEYTYAHTNTVQATLYLQPGADVVRICSRPIGEGWEQMERCRLFAWRDGELKMASQPHGHTFDNDLYMRIIRQELETQGSE